MRRTVCLVLALSMPSAMLFLTPPVPRGGLLAYYDELITEGLE